MQIYKILVMMFSLTSIILLGCDNLKQHSTEEKSFFNSDDSASNNIIQTFALPFSNNIKNDSGLLVFYCARSYDTTTLIELKNTGNTIRGVFYEILLEYHRYPTDFADTSSKLIFFQGTSFTIDSIEWKSVIDQANKIFGEKDNLTKKLKYTDPSSYALYFNGQSKHGDDNNYKPFEELDSLIRVRFLNNYRQLRKPKMYKKK